MKKLLCVISSMNAGGAETYLMKIYRNIDKTKYQMDFCVNVENNYYADEIKSLGGKIYVLPLKSKEPFKSFCTLKKIVRENNYERVLRVNEHSLSTLDLLAAKMGGARILGMRSSNSSSGSGVSLKLHKVFRFLTSLIPNVKIAPSTEAAIYTFGEKEVESGKVIFIHNGLDIDAFSFDKNSRNEYRNQLNISGKMVIGHIGRFNSQKNHTFIVDIFEELLKKIPNAVLMLVGNGDLQKEIEEKVRKINIEDKVLFLELRSDIPQLLSAMDVFLFPSLYEGMPNTVIEAQAADLPCVIADTITKEANITGNITYVPLASEPKVWADKVYESYRVSRNNMRGVFISKRYDIDSVVSEFINTIFEV